MKDRMKNQQDKMLANQYLDEIKSLTNNKPYTIMEVCGTHTVAIAKNALRDLLPPEIKLISGPGCPVCITDNSDIDRFLYLAAQPNVITATFGDMIRVPGSEKRLQDLRAEGADIRVVYSTLDALEIARKNPNKEVVFLGVGFETTVPTVAVSLILAQKEGIKNFSVISMHKVVPPVLKALAEDSELKVDGFLDPGHVCSIIGTHPLEFMAKEYGKPGVVTGFEALDILEGILLLFKQHIHKRCEIEIQYCRAVKPEGNLQAQKYIENVFETVDVRYRGMGVIPLGGLKIRKEYEQWDAVRKFALPEFPSYIIPGCRCGDVLRGMIDPEECSLFHHKCTPVHPIGPCMVSSEGSCAAHYRYTQRR